jgi:hypothetical protein
MKLLSQLEEVERPTPFARREEGNISAGIAQGTGPQLAPKAGELLEGTKIKKRV